MMPEKIIHLCSSWYCYGVNGRSKLFGECLLHAIICGIWKERNNIIFQNKSRNFEEVIDVIIWEVGSWLIVTSEFKDISLLDFVRDWITSISWSTPSNPSHKKLS